jgi:hypothetical protein
MKNNKTITESIVEIAKLYDGTVNRPDWRKDNGKHERNKRT